MDAANTDCKGGCCCGSSSSSNVPSSETDTPSNNNDQKSTSSSQTTPLAVVKEGGGVVIFDRTGLPRSYHHTSPDLCFDDCHPNSSTIYCLDESGQHGVPSDECACGIQDQPHLHAHYKSQCETTSTKRIDNVVLFPDDAPYQLESMKDDPPPECCPSDSTVQRTTHAQQQSNYTLISTIQHDDHHDALVVSNTNRNELELQHDCEYCGAWITHGKFEKLYARPLLSPQHPSLSFYQVQRKPQLLQSTLYVSSICCASEIPLIERVLHGHFSNDDLSSVRVNTTSKLVYIQHTSPITTQALSECLNQQGFANDVRQEASSTTTAAVSQTVSSVFHIENPFDESILQELVDSRQLESYEWEDDDSKTRLIVTHAPANRTAPQLVDLLQTRHRVRAAIITDGLQDALHRQSNEILAKETSNSARWPRPTVVVSGLFWIISMLSLLGGNLEHLKWVALASVAFGLPPIANKALRTLFRKQLDANCLMLFASLGAIALQDFTEAGAVVFLFALSEWLEVRATTRARQALSAICELQPDTAELVQPQTRQVVKVPASMVAVQSLVSVRTGDVVPCDGIIVEGVSTVDESSLTGESRPIRKGPNDKVSGGTLNSGLSPLMIRTTATADSSAVSKLIRLVETAQANRSDTEKLVDRFAAYYTPIIVLAAVLMCSVPWAFGKDTGNEWTHNGLILIVVACPCALIISTPVCYVAGLTAAAQKGVLIKGGAFLEALNSVRTICFDKTGTLTNGEFAILHMDVVASSLGRQSIWEYLVVMEDRASHPVAQAILAAARSENVHPSNLQLEQHKIVNGEGVTGIVNGKQVNVGNERMFERLGLLSTLSTEYRRRIQQWKALGGTVGYMSIEGHGIVCAYCAADSVRKESKRVLKGLKKRGIKISMLTGDNNDAAIAIGRQVGLETSEIQSKLLPEEKLNYVKTLADKSTARAACSCNPCSKRELVMMCGDGVNDAPALAAADVGIAMGEGAALSMETSDITLLDSNLEKIEYSIRLGKKVTGKIIQNVVFSLVTKFIVLGFALAGKAELWAAIATDVGSMLLVTLNAMTLLPRKQAAALVQSDLHNSCHRGANQPYTEGCCEGEKKVDRESCSKGCCDGPKAVDEPVTSCSKGCCEREHRELDAPQSDAKGCCDGSETIESQSCTKRCCEKATADECCETEIVPNTCATGCRGVGPVAAASCGKGCCGGEEAECNLDDSCAGKDACCTHSKEKECGKVGKPATSKSCAPSTAAECCVQDETESKGCTAGCCGGQQPVETTSCAEEMEPARASSCQKGCCGTGN